MKKKIFLGLLLGALSFGSCVKDNESEAVKKQRDAQAELLLAKAKVQNADAEFKAAEARIKNAQADLEEALKQSKVDASVASATMLTASATVALEEAKLAKAKAEATFADNLAAAKAEANSTKIDKVSNLVTAVNSATTLYSSAVSDVTEKQSQTNALKVERIKLEAGITSATEFVELEKAKEDRKIDAAKVKIAAFEEAIESGGYETLDKLKKQYTEKENAAKLALSTRDAESKRVYKGFYSNTTSAYGKAKAAVESSTVADLEFFKKLNQVFTLVKERTSESRANSVVLNRSAGGTFEVVTSTSSVNIVENYDMFKPLITTKDALVKRFFSKAQSEAVESEFKDDIDAKEDTKKQYTASQTAIEAKIADLKQKLSTATSTASKTAYESEIKSKTTELANVKDQVVSATTAWEKAKKNQDDYKKAIEAIEKEQNQEAVLTVINEFLKQQKELKDVKLAKVEELNVKYQAAENEKLTLSSAIEAIQSAIGAVGATGTSTVEKIENEIQEAKKSIVEAEYNKEKLDNVTTAQQALDLIDQKIKLYEQELALLERKLEAVKQNYEAALTALADAMKS